MSVELRIAQAEQCVAKLEQYINGLDAISKMLEVVIPFSQYDKQPDDFKIDQKQSIHTIVGDLKSMRAEAWDLVSSKRDKVKNLYLNREKNMESMRHKC